MFKNYKRNLLAAVVGAFLVLIAFPTVASASASITSFSMNRTSITHGQTVTISITTSATVNYVFATVDDVRVNGTRQTGNTWQLVVSPRRTQDITVVANTENRTTNAATVTIPVSVLSGISPPITLPPTTQPPTVTPPTVTPPTVVPPVGALAIHSITETPATAVNHVQLTVVTGVGANEVWVQFDENRFRRGQEQTALRTDTTRTWVIEFLPQHWAVQTVRVNANREYIMAGATVQNYALTLAAPFVPPIVPTIQSATANVSTVAPGGTVTVTVRTNLDVNFVWLIDADGNRRNASPSGSPTATGRNWVVSFPPGRTGSVTVFANAVNEDTGAVSRSMQITVQQHIAAILTPTTANWSADFWATGWRSVIVEVTTNQFANHVWVQLPGGGTHSLSRIGTGTGNRTWRVEIHDVDNISTLQVHASDVSGSWVTSDSRTLTIGGQAPAAGLWADMPSHSWARDVRAVQSGSNIIITFNTDQMSGSWDWSLGVTIAEGMFAQWATSANGRNWTVTLHNVWLSTLFNTSIQFNDQTGTGRGVISGTFRSS